VKAFAVIGAVAVASACAATGVTLRSNHYRVYVPADWQVVEAGGDGVLPTLLSIRGQGDRDPPIMQIRIYTWVVQGPVFDFPNEAIDRLVNSNAIIPHDGESSVEASAARCPDGDKGFVVFGQPVRAVHFEDLAGMRNVLTAGYARGSLVAVVATTLPKRPLCADIAAMHAAIRRLTASLAPAGDASRAGASPTIIEGAGGLPIEIPAPDPSLLP
jgi:hypothetical protein